MSHELTQRANGAIEFAYRADHGAPWHGLGQALSDNASHEDWRAAAGFDWQVKRSRVRFGEGANQQIDETNHVLFRSDSKAALGIVSPTYKIVQPGEVLDFFRDVAKAGGLELSSAGTILGGQRFWATAKIGEASPVSVRDKIGGYLLLSTSADGSLATEVRLTSIRVVCKNTLQFARADSKASIRLSHRSVFDPKAIQSQLGLTVRSWDAFRANVSRLANKAIIPEQAGFLTAQILTGEDKLSANDLTKASESKAFQTILRLFDGDAIGSELHGVHGTAWGLLNAVTEFQDHHARARSEENRFVASQWGAGNDVKSRALDLLLAV